MSFKINVGAVNFGPSSIGPSKEYYDTQSRFQEILQTKLGAKSIAYSDDKLLVSSFNSEDVTKPSGVTKEELDARFMGTNLEGLGADFVAAEQKYGINAWFLSGLAAHESGLGTSRIALDKNNLFGFKAYDSSPYSSAASYGSYGESMDDVAKYLSEAYVNPTGKYYNGLSVEAIGKRYATDPNWSNGVMTRISQLMKE